MSYTDVTGRWVQPKAVCEGGVASSLAIWVGLGGYSLTSGELEQIGTEADCDDHGTAELLRLVRARPGRPGQPEAQDRRRRHDRLGGQGERARHPRAADGSNPRDEVHPPSEHGEADLTSAEWVVEAPNLCDGSGFCKQPPLTRFHSLAFTNTYATGNGLGGTISSPSWISTRDPARPAGAPVLRRPERPRLGRRTVGGDAFGSPPGRDGLLREVAGKPVKWQANP